MGYKININGKEAEFGPDGWEYHVYRNYWLDGKTPVPSEAWEAAEKMEIDDE